MSENLKPVFRSVRYREAGIKTKWAYAQFNYASAEVNIAKIEERAAEVASQAFQFVGDGGLQKRFGALSDREREIGIALARYAAYGTLED